MDNQKIAAALVDLADMANSISGDFHTMHLNVKGAEFDTMHKAVLKKYYEDTAEDYDSLAEFAACYQVAIPNTNESAARIDYKSAEGKIINKNEAVERSSEILDLLCKKYLEVFRLLEQTDCPIAVGISNWLQGRLEYWAKEMAYFNARRSE